MNYLDRIDLLTSALDKSKKLLDMSTEMINQHEKLNLTNNELIGNLEYRIVDLEDQLLLSAKMLENKDEMIAHYKKVRKIQSWGFFSIFRRNK